MRKMILAGYVLMVICFFVFVPVIESQEPGPGEMGWRRSEQKRGRRSEKQHRKRDKAREMILSLKIWKLTEELKIDEDLAEKLYPKVRILEAQRFEMRKNMELAMADLETIMNSETLDKKKLELTILRIRSLRSEHFQSENKIMDEIMSLLTVEQQAKFILVEMGFHDDVKRFLRERRGNMHGRGK